MIRSQLSRRAFGALGLAALAAPPARAPPADPLPSWREGPRQRALRAFVAAVAAGGGAELRGAGSAHRRLRQ